jgi:hypothetical protein
LGARVTEKETTLWVPELQIKRRMVGCQSNNGRFEEDENSCLSIQPRFFSRLLYRFVFTPTETHGFHLPQGTSAHSLASATLFLLLKVTHAKVIRFVPIQYQFPALVKWKILQILV